MHIVNENVNHALCNGILHLLGQGIKESSRNGEVLVSPQPVTTTYLKPTERVLFSPLRDANPYFHLMESLWMLCGRNDVAFPAEFNKRFKEYSDDGTIAWGAYGYRWRNFFGYDQLELIANELKVNPTSRRCVLTMWNAMGLVGFDDGNEDIPHDLQVAIRGGKDVPCNTHVYFDARGGRLNMTVCCRSNDILWGAYGANAVHFSMLQEYMAAWVGVPVGLYHQFSNNFHMYTELYGHTLDKLDAIAHNALGSNYYLTVPVQPYPLVSTDINVWNDDLRQFMAEPDSVRIYRDNFFNEVARPMYKSYMERKTKAGNGLRWLEAMGADDWKLACLQWIARREKGN